MSRSNFDLVFKHPNSNHSVVIEDDGRVAYAYLRTGHQIIGDVWLYNHGEAPVEHEWQSKGRMPFKNSQEFVSRIAFSPIGSPDDVAIEWLEAEKLIVNIFLKGKLHARLMPQAMPGWCRLACKDGPVAKILA